MPTATKIIVKRSDFEREVRADESPDLSHLGEYSNEATSPDAIDRKERGDMKRGELRYFNPAMTGEETGNPESPEQDYERMEAYNAGDWRMIGIRATVEIAIPCGSYARTQTLKSPGLWGIESDSDEAELESIFDDECMMLAEMVQALKNIELVD